MSWTVENLKKKYDEANDGPLIPTSSLRGRSFTTSSPSQPSNHDKRKTKQPPQFNNRYKRVLSGVGNDIGQTDTYFFRITYHISIEEARKIQQEASNDKAVTKQDWFSDDDFDELAKTLKEDDDGFNVCICAKPGVNITDGYFKYCSDSEQSCIPVVEVNLYKNNEPYCAPCKIQLISKRWDNKFKIVPGPLPP